MQPQRREAYDLGLAQFVFIRKPYRVTANEILVKQIDVMRCQVILFTWANTQINRYIINIIRDIVIKLRK